MNGVSKSSGQSTVYSTSTATQLEEQKPAETKSPEPEKPAPKTAQSNSSERGKVGEQALAGQIRAEQLKSEMAKSSSANKAVEQIQTKFQERFNKLSENKQEFHSLMKEVYGQNYDASSAEDFRLRSLKGDFRAGCLKWKSGTIER